MEGSFVAGAIKRMPNASSLTHDLASWSCRPDLTRRRAINAVSVSLSCAQTQTATHICEYAHTLSLNLDEKFFVGVLRRVRASARHVHSPCDRHKHALAAIPWCVSMMVRVCAMPSELMINCCTDIVMDTQGESSRDQVEMSIRRLFQKVMERTDLQQNLHAILSIASVQEHSHPVPDCQDDAPPVSPSTSHIYAT